ncbi:MAG: hypothetical protein L0Y61_01160, partial [Epsilonproteobacteria bacterium]|nr:hypothetical protein [Campylobacterota bacterium]
MSDADYQAAQEEILSNLDNDTEIKTETEETVVQQEQEVDNFEEETEELPTQTPTINEEELRKQIEKDLKKKYLSQVSMKAKEADRYRQELEVIKNNFDEDSLTTVEKVVEAKLYEQELNRLEKVEFNNFLKLNPEAKQNLADIQEIKNDFPNMSWERAY